jgi:acyl-CoA synthetase (AMP-forming)/AMP-acid ligase II
VEARFVRLLERENTLQAIYEIMMSDSLETHAGQWLDDSGSIVSVSFRTFDHDVKNMAGFLTKKLGEKQRGSFVGLAMDNSILWQTCFWALLMAGFKPVLIDTNLKEEMLDYIIE